VKTSHKPGTLSAIALKIILANILDF